MASKLDPKMDCNEVLPLHDVTILTLHWDRYDDNRSNPVTNSRSISIPLILAMR